MTLILSVETVSLLMLLSFCAASSFRPGEETQMIFRILQKMMIFQFNRYSFASSDSKLAITTDIKNNCKTFTITK